LQYIKYPFDLIRSALGALKDVRDTMPDDTKRQAVTQILEQTERASLIAEARIAKALGYQLCQCTFPPQIMRYVGEWRPGQDRFECPACKRFLPSEAHVRQHEALDVYNRGRRVIHSGIEWMGR
jgi:hypothetical protein